MLYVLLGLIFFAVKIASAADSADFIGPPVEAATPAAEVPVAGVTEPGLLQNIDAPRDYLSEKIVEYSTNLDHFFGDERYFQENNKSVIQMNLSETMAQSGNNAFAVEGQAKLDLPAAQHRFQFVLQSNPEKNTAGEVKKDQPVDPNAAKTSDKYAASLRYSKAEEERWHYSTEAGIKFQFPLDPFARARVSYSMPVLDWRLKLSENVFWFSTIGLGETTQFDMEHVLSEPVLFRATTTSTCYEAPQNCDLRQDMTVYHTLNERTALLYQASVIGVSQPSLTETAYVLLVRYRYRMHKDWIFLELNPQLNFPKTDDFKLNAYLLLRLEILFGAKQ